MPDGVDAFADCCGGGEVAAGCAGEAVPFGEGVDGPEALPCPPPSFARRFMRIFDMSASIDSFWPGAGMSLTLSASDIVESAISGFVGCSVSKIASK